MASNNNKNKTRSATGSTAARRATTASRPAVNKVTAKPVAARPRTVATARPVARNPVLVASAPAVRQRAPASLESMGTTSRPRTSTRTPTPPTTPPRPPDAPPATTAKSGRVSNLRLDPGKPRTVAKAKTVTTKKPARDPEQKNRTTKASSATPRDDKTKVTCKARPDNNKPSAKSGGGGSMKRFIPWCG